MSNWSWLLISALAWVSPIFAGAAWSAPPARVELASEIARNGITLAEMVYVLDHDGRTYRITETSKGRGMLALRGTTRRTSRGIVSAQGLRPVEFTDERSGRNTARANFDWEMKTVTLQYKGEPRTEPLPPHAHDRLAFIFDFGFAPRRSEAEFDLFDGRGQSRHVYKAAGRERIKIPLGEFDALRFMRGNEEERTEIWIGSESGLPLRILVVEKDGTRYEQVTTKISPP
jgi:Protein of unknown function (DUF3108)